MELSERIKPTRRKESIPGRIAQKKRRVKYPTKKEGLLYVLSILKSIFVSSLSFVDVGTDLWLGIDLVYDLKDQRSAALKTEAEKYGYAVLSVIWLPGLVVFDVIQVFRIVVISWHFWTIKVKAFCLLSC